MLFEYVTSATVMPRSIAACRSTWSEPMPAVIGELQLRRLGDPLGGQVRGPERLRDDDVGVGQLALELRVRPVLVGGDDERVARAPRGSCAGPSSPETLPSSSPGVKSIACGVGVVCPSG